MSFIGCVGDVILATRGKDGAGEAFIEINGTRQACIAWSEEPIGEGVKVLVIDDLAVQTVLVEPLSKHFSTLI